MHVYVYDKASWHTGGDYPAELPESQARVHMGLFLAWMIEHDLHDPDFFADVGLDGLVAAVKARALTGAELLEPLAGVLASDELSAEGNAFARAYYESQYVLDYQAVLGSGQASIYHVADTWANYDRLKDTIDRRYQAWLCAGRPPEAPSA